MSVSSKCYYALRAIYALAELNSSTEPLKISHIAEREQIPIRFLEVIPGNPGLKGRGSPSRSKRGAEGSTFLARPAEELTIGGDVMRFVDGPIAPAVDCVSQSLQECEFQGDCHFFGFWGRVRQAMSDVVDKTTFADLDHAKAGTGRRPTSATGRSEVAWLILPILALSGCVPEGQGGRGDVLTIGAYSVVREAAPRGLPAGLRRQVEDGDGSTTSRFEESANGSGRLIARPSPPGSTPISPSSRWRMTSPRS